MVRGLRNFAPAVAAISVTVRDMMRCIYTLREMGICVAMSRQSTLLSVNVTDMI